ncbi:PLP-dependent cysteine synthase family protein [Halovivax sp.]|uniref:PLP-dependent cysteine synthase family protein n=1 Tax=Halovivax sp. TaxID=1935978 RepID=UPI0025BACE4A|nr:PLP-dependent cysteine synthase family protein [Halovivax sp.]
MRASILDTIGSPLVEVDAPDGATVAAKVESFNPGGSAKDRPAMAMVRAAERAGSLGPGDRIVEPTSGNTGIGLAVVCAARGYDLTIVMPADKSAERRRLMTAYGADIELVDGDMTDARARADELATDGAVQLGQFENPANPNAHYRTTGAEIVEQVGDRTVDAFVAGVGTGGTLSGVGRRLRERFPDVEIVAVEPAGNAVLSTGCAGEDDFQGMGPGFVSENLDRTLLDDVRTVALEDAEAECRRLAREEGILVGQSSGAASLVAREIAERIAEPDRECPEIPHAFDRHFGRADSPDETSRPDHRGGRAGSQRASSGSERSPPEPETDGGESVEDCPLVVTVFPDSGERYLSTGLFD